MSDTGYSWKNVRYGSGRQVSHSDHLTRWILIAIFLAVICHVVVLLAMTKMPIFFNSDESEEIITQSVVVRNVMDREYIDPSQEPEVSEVIEPSKMASNLLEELEMLEDAPEDIELNFSPTIDVTDIQVPQEAPAIIGDENATAEDLTAGLEITESIEDLGSTDDFLQPAVGQIIIDPGQQAADEFDPDEFNTEVAKGAGGDLKERSIEGFTPLAEMTSLSQADLEKAKGMIGSDLLYDFGKSVLRDSAKNSLLKVVLIIDKNPNMKCWIEGHTDLIGSDEANAKLSLARAEAVKYWLVNSMKIDADRLYVRGLGESHPIIVTGDQKAQAINRRVEIKMRTNAPLEQSSPDIIPESEPATSNKARVIKPLRNPNLPEASAIPPEIPPERVQLEEADTDLTSIPAESIAPRAVPVEDEPTPPAIPIIPPAPPKAILVE